jgi:nucleoside-diphosphate-sugar epimerase
MAMRVFILGGSGLIGAAIVRNLVSAGHHVFALARNENSAAHLAVMGAWPIRGDIHNPGPWCDKLPVVDAVIHAACDFSADMGAVDAGMLIELLHVLHRQSGPKAPALPRFIYTGGSWLYPAMKSSDAIHDEKTPFAPVPGFEWMVTGLTKILSDPALHGMVIHPATVYRTDPPSRTRPTLPGGALHDMARRARDENRVRIVGDGPGDEVVWPLIHADDLADLYRLVLENGERGQSYIGVGIEGIATGDLARQIAQTFGRADCEIEHISPDDIAREYGQWALGLAHSHRMTSQKAIRELGWQPRHTDIARDLQSCCGVSAAA